MSVAEATASPSWCSLRASCRFILGGPAAWSSQASARLWPQLRVGRIARVAKGGLLRTFVQPDPFFKHRVWVNKKYQSFEKSGKTGTKFPTREIVSFPTSKSIYLYNQMISPASGSVHLMCVHRGCHWDLSWRWHVQRVKNEKECCGTGNVFFGSRKLLLPGVQIGTMERVSLLLKGGVQASPFDWLFPGNCFSGWIVSIHSRFEHFQLKRWHCKLCIVDIYFQCWLWHWWVASDTEIVPVDEHQRLKVGWNKAISSKMCRHVANALEQSTHASISTCLHTHEYAREDAHEYAHVQTCYTHTQTRNQFCKATWLHYNRMVWIR